MMEMKKLTDICDIQYGYAFDSKCFTEDSSYPQLVRIRDVKKGYSETYYSGDYPKEYILTEGDLLIGMDGEFNIARWKCSGALLNQRVCKLTAKVGTNEEYLRFAMSKSLKEIEKRTAFVTVKHLSAKELNKLELDVPELSKQDKIADTLSRLERIIEAREEELEKLDDLIKARFVEMFGSIYDNKYGYNVMTLQDVCEPIKDGTHQTPTYTEDTVNGFKFLSSKDVTSGKVDWDHLKYIPEELHNELYKRISPRKGDILLAKNGTTGVAAIVDRDEVFDIYISLALLKPLEMVTAEYLCSAVNSLETKHQFDHSLKGIGVPNLHLGEIKKTKIIVPPIELQKQFADFVHQVDKSKVVVQKALDETQILFNSLMQQYFG